MRGYHCYVSFAKSKAAERRPCWSALHGKANKVVYIGGFDDAATAKYQGTLTGLVNRITPCDIVAAPATWQLPFMSWLLGRRRKATGRYIRFKMLDTYDKSLVLLNFIRNLWHEPKAGYTRRFFESLEASPHQDPLARLTWANKEALTEMGFNRQCNYSPGHSNVHRSHALKVKTVEQLHAYCGNSTYAFLTGD